MECEERFIQMVIKIAIITFTSLFMTIIDAVVSTLRIVLATESMMLLVNHVMLWDIFTNCLCMALSYNTFDNWYGKLCGGLDRKCQSRFIQSPVNML